MGNFRLDVAAWTNCLSFFESTVPEECREKIRSFQRDALMRRPNLNVLAAEALEISEETFEIMGSPEAVLEGAIASFEWSFWQYSNYSQCESIFLLPKLEITTT